MAAMLSPTRIHEARVEAGLTQSDLAYRLRDIGISADERSVRRWETGQNEPRANVIPAIAQATGKQIEFFYPEDETAPFRTVAAA